MHPSREGSLLTNVALDTEIYLSRIVALCLLTLALISVFVPAGYISLLLTLFHVANFIYIYTVYLFLSSSLPSYTPGGIISSTPNTTGLILGLIGYGKHSPILPY